MGSSNSSSDDDDSTTPEQQRYYYVLPTTWVALCDNSFIDEFCSDILSGRKRDQRRLLKKHHKRKKNPQTRQMEDNCPSAANRYF
jgi:hypothetical protein